MPIPEFDITELNTEYYSRPGWHDETSRISCDKCGHWFKLGPGMFNAPRETSITEKHLDLCEGDAPTTLMKIEQAYKAGWRPE